MNHYYAYNNQYGIGTTDTNGNRIGSIVIFDTKAERDVYVFDEINAERLTSSEAKREIARELRSDYDYEETMSDLVQLRSISELVSMLRREREYYGY